MPIEIVLWRSKGSETLEVSSIFDFRVVRSGFDALFIVISNQFEGIEKEVMFRNEKML